MALSLQQRLLTSEDFKKEDNFLADYHIVSDFLFRFATDLITI